MRPMPGGSSARGQRGGGGHAHSIAATELLRQQLAGGQPGDAGSLRSSWRPVRGAGAEEVATGATNGY